MRAKATIQMVSCQYDNPYNQEITIPYLIYSFSVSSIRQQPVETTVENLTNLKCKMQVSPTIQFSHWGSRELSNFKLNSGEDFAFNYMFLPVCFD